MKIWIFSLEYSPAASGGVGTHVEELSNGLALAGDSVTVIAGTVGRPQQFSETNKTVHLVPPDEIQQPNRTISQGLLDYNRKLAAYAQKEVLPGSDRPDVVHCHNWISYPAAAELARATGARLVTTVHYVSAVEEWWGRPADPEIVVQEKNLFRSAETFIAVSQSIRSLMRDVYGVPEERVKVVYNAVDCQSFLQGDLVREELIRLRQRIAPSRGKIVLYTGRFHRMKGITALLQSVALVLEQEPNVRYVMAGEPDSKSMALEFRELMNKMPILKDHVMVLGKLSRNRVALLYSVADLAVLPSVYDPCPYAAIEAMAAGVPLIASDGGGLAELVQHGVNGLTVHVQPNAAGFRSVDPQELANATLLLLRNAGLAKKLGQAGREKAAEAYAFDTMVRNTREVYQIALTRAHEATRLE